MNVPRDIRKKLAEALAVAGLFSPFLVVLADLWALLVAVLAAVLYLLATLLKNPVEKNLLLR